MDALFVTNLRTLINDVASTNGKIRKLINDAVTLNARIVYIKNSIDSKHGKEDRVRPVTDEVKIAASVTSSLIKNREKLQETMNTLPIDLYRLNDTFHMIHDYSELVIAKVHLAESHADIIAVDLHGMRHYADILSNGLQPISIKIRGLKGLIVEYPDQPDAIGFADEMELNSNYACTILNTATALAREMDTIAIRLYELTLRVRCDEK